MHPRAGPVTTTSATAPATTERRWRSLVTIYRATGRTAVLQAIQYRVPLFLMMAALLTEPVVYLVVWRSVARESGGSVDGFTEGRFAAYYIVWTFVRQTSQFGTGMGWEQLIRSGDLNKWLLQPMHPIHDQLAGSPAFSLVQIFLWVPIGVPLVLVFRPDMHTTPLQMVAFPLTILMALVIGVLTNAIIGFTAFWLTRIRAIVNVVWTMSLLLSGRLVPVELLPSWARAISSVLWFRWIMDFPITTLIGPTSGRDILIGLGMQVLWIGLATLGVRTIWRRGVRRFGAVGG